MSVLAVEIDDFVSAAEIMYRDAGGPAGAAVMSLSNRLLGSGGMAGTDAGGAQWASAYDSVARHAVHAGQDAMNACYLLSAMFTRSARNYEAAEAASSARGRSSPLASHALPNGVVRFTLAGPLPSAAGAAPAPIASMAGVLSFPTLALANILVPSGHQDKLHAAADVWRDAARTLTHVASTVMLAPLGFVDDRLPEAGDIRAVCNGIRVNLLDLVHVYHVLARACDDYAHHLDAVRSEVEAQVAWLAAESAFIEGLSALLAFPTGGWSEYEGNLIESDRVAVATARIRQVIDEFTIAVRGAASSISGVFGRLDLAAGELAGLVDLRLSYATVQVVRSLPPAIRIREVAAAARLEKISEGLPAMVFRAGQVERKFKHAAVFGVTESRGRDGMHAFEKALMNFLEQPGTVRVTAARARYNKDPAIISYNSETRLVVIQHVDGAFWSAWKLKPEAMYYLRKYGTLGGQR